MYYNAFCRWLFDGFPFLDPLKQEIKKMKVAFFAL